MGVWRRCPEGFFYRRVSRDLKRYDRKTDSFDRLYVDPIDLTLIRTIPWRGTHVQVLRWWITALDPSTFLEILNSDQAQVLEAWSERIVHSIDPHSGQADKRMLLEDLDVDAAARDQLLDAVEFFVNVSPPRSTALTQIKIPRSDQALEGALLGSDVGRC